MAFLVWLVLACFYTSVEADFDPLSRSRSIQLPIPSVEEPPIVASPSELVVPTSPTVASACRATRFPDLCNSLLSADSRSGTLNSTELVALAIELALTGSTESLSSIQGLVLSVDLDINATAAAEVCEESLDYAITSLMNSKEFLLVYAIEDIQAWLSASEQFQYDCFSGLSNVQNPPEGLLDAVLPLVNSSMERISNALSLTNSLAIYGSDSALWQPPQEQRSTPVTLPSINAEWTTQDYLCSFQAPPDILTPNATVAQDGSGTYTSVQQAVDNAPTYGTDRYTIYIKEGIYNERVRVHKNKTMITFVGVGGNKTIITASKNALEAGVPTYQTATVVVVGKSFSARGITFQNTAGPELHQAVAMRVDGDLAAFEDCVFDGYQDTLYAHTGRQFYTNCTILGTVDFVFGNSAALFRSCQLLVRSGRADAPTSVLTAQGRTDPGQSTGLVFQNCTISGTPDYMEDLRENPASLQSYLGRPWKRFSRTVFIDSYLDSVIQPEGWLAWDGTFALDSLFYGEYQSSGPGAVSASRVPWSNQLTSNQADAFGVERFIQGNRWLPCAGIS